MTSALVHAARSMVRAPGHTAIVLTTFALGLGINAAILATLDRLMFRPLPYGEPSRIVQIHSWVSADAAAAPFLEQATGAAISGRASSLGGLAFVQNHSDPVYIDGLGDTPVVLALATSNLLDVLRVRPVVGRDFSPDEVRTGGPGELLLSFQAWLDRFGGDPGVLERLIGIGDSQYRIIGVLPREFVVPSAVRTGRPDALLVRTNRFQQQPESTSALPAAIARLEAGFSLEQARAEVNLLLRTLRHTNRELDQLEPITIQPLQRGLYVVYSQYLWTIIGAGGILLAIASLNLLTLLVAASAARRLDYSLHLVFGASPRGLRAGRLIEALVTCLCGGVLALLVFAWAQPIIVAFVPAAFRGFVAGPVDQRIATITLSASAACGLVVGVWSTLVIRPSIVPSQSKHADPLTRPLPPVVTRGLMFLEACLTVVLVTAAMFVGRDFVALLLRNDGFEPKDLYILTVSARKDEDENVTAAALGAALREALLPMPGLRGIAVANQSVVGVGHMENTDKFWASVGTLGSTVGVSSGFFEVIRTPVKAGRTFTAVEEERAALVAILSAKGVDVLWPGEAPASAVGRFVATLDGAREVVGVVADVRPLLGSPSTPALYLPVTAEEIKPELGRTWRIFVRTMPGIRLDVHAATINLRRLAVISRLTVDSVEEKALPFVQGPRFLTGLFTTFAAAALALSAASLYALATLIVVTRRSEIALRFALGATEAQVWKLLAVDCVVPVAVGGALGLLCYWWTSKVAVSLVFGLTLRDPVVGVLSASMLLGTAVIATAIPVRRAAQSDPAGILKV